MVSVILISFYLVSIVVFWIVYYFVEMVGQQKSQDDLVLALMLSVCPLLNNFAIFDGIMQLISKKLQNSRSLKWDRDHFKFD